MPEMLAVTAAVAGAGTRQGRRADHRRPVQRRHEGVLGRPRRARGVRRRADRARPRAVTGSWSTRRSARGVVVPVDDASSPPGVRRGASPRPGTRRARWPSTPKPWARPTRGRDVVTRDARHREPRGLQCRICGCQYAVEPLTICEECFGPLEPAYDLQSIDGDEFRAHTEAGPRSLWRYDRLLPGGPGVAAGRPRRRVHAAPQGGPAGGRPRPADALDQGRHGQPIELVQGPRGDGRDHDGPRVRLRGDQLRLDRQPRQRDRGACRQGRHALLRLRARRPGAGEDPGHRGVRGQGRRRQGELRRREPAVQRGRRRAAVGVRQREHAAVLRRGIEVAGLRGGGAARLAPARPRRRARSRRGRCSPRSTGRSASSSRSGPWTRSRTG